MQPLDQQVGRTWVVGSEIDELRSGSKSSERAPPITAHSDRRCGRSLANVVADFYFLLRASIRSHRVMIEREPPEATKEHELEAAVPSFLNGRAHRAATCNSVVDSKLIIRDRGRQLQCRSIHANGVP